MTTGVIKLCLALLAVSLVSIAVIIRKKLGSGRNYQLQIRIRCESGSVITINKYYRFEFAAILAAWIYSPDPKLPWIVYVNTKIERCNG